MVSDALKIHSAGIITRQLRVRWRNKWSCLFMMRPGLDVIHQKFWPADGTTVANAIMSTFTNDDIRLKQLLTLEGDGPNVSNIIWRLLPEQKSECPAFKGFVDIGTCSIHFIHNSFGKSIEKYGKDCEQLAIDLHSLFKYSAARREAFRELQFNLDLEQRIFLDYTSLW